MIPGYFLQVRCLLPALQHSILLQLNCGKMKRPGQPAATEYAAAGLRAR